jgi:hypothetical protein
VVTPAWIALRPGKPVTLLPDALVHDLLPGAITLRSWGDEWIVGDEAHGPRRFLENHFARMVRKRERAFFYFIGIDNRGRWLFRKNKSPDGQTLILDPTLPDTRPKLPVWVYPVQDGNAGWTNQNWPAVEKGGAWVLDHNHWRPLDEKREKFSMDVPPPPAEAKVEDRGSKVATTTQSSVLSPQSSAATAPATTQFAETEPPILVDPDGTRYYDGSTTLRMRTKDGREITWPLPPSAVGNGDVWLFRVDERTFFLFNQPGRVLRIARQPAGSAEPFKLEAVFTHEIPNTDTAQRIWLDPSGRICIALSGELRILFPDGQVPPELARMMLSTGSDEDDDDTQ